uniref:Squidulin n=1 Tax=Caligus clemensi TaxID=344056 RepID=C1C0W7_CALCM|nr:Squidulin [Caligus clemensi]
MTELREAFELFDVDKNGIVTKEEVINLFASLGHEISPSTLDSYFKLASKDESKNGMNFEEFKMLWSCLSSPEPPTSEIREEFHRLDKDSDGYISTEEMMNIVERFSHTLKDRTEIAKECLKDIDINKDGRVSLPEFLICWKYKSLA